MDDSKELKNIDKAFHPRAVSSGTLAGKRLGPRGVTKLAFNAGFRDLDLYLAVMVCGSESWFFTQARNDNIDDATGAIKSRDVGLMQINIPASQIGTQVENDLYIPEKNFARAFSMWQNRKWQPWVGFTSHACFHDTYLQWALLGVANYHDEILLQMAKDFGQAPKTRLPWISIPDLRKLYPDVQLG